MSRIDIYLPGNPSTRTAQQKGETVINGRTHHYEKKEVRLVKQELLRRLKPYAPDVPVDGPICLQVDWAFELKRLRHNEWKTTRPDLDNLEKGLLDVMTEAGFWKDDAQVVIKTTSKKAVPVGKGYLHISIRTLSRAWEVNL